MDYRSFVPLIAAVMLALITFLVSRRSNFTIQRSAASRLESFASKDQRGLTDRVGDLLVDRLGLRLEAWKHELRWAQIGGHYFTGDGKPRMVGSVLGQSVLFGGLGLIYILLFRAFSPIYLIVAALGAYYPYMTLRSRADTVRDAVKRGLPEAAALVAAEMNAGNSITLAVERASSLPGPAGLLLREAVDRARSDGALLFSQAGAAGVTVSHFAELRFTPLETFAARMDAVAERGTEGPQRMNELARDLAMEYRVTVARAAETLDNKLLMPMTIFFFVPFLAAIFIPLMLNILNTF
jgi:Flp pilus assembly protein TadB